MISLWGKRASFQESVRIFPQKILVEMKNQILNHREQLFWHNENVTSKYRCFTKWIPCNIRSKNEDFWATILFASRFLEALEMKYPTKELEGLNVIWATALIKTIYDFPCLEF